MNVAKLSIEPTERGRVHPVVRLAAEIVGLRIDLDPVFLAGDLAGREIVDVLDPAGQISMFKVPANLAHGTALLSERVIVLSTLCFLTIA